MRRFRIWVGEPLGAPAGEDADREGALIRPLRGTSPLGEKGSGGRPGVPPLPTSSASLRSAPSPKGEGLRAADSRPYSPPETSRGARQGFAPGAPGGHIGPPLRLFDGIFNYGRAGLGPAPTADTEAVPHFVGNGPKPTRRSQTSRHLLGKARRGCGIASAAILEQPGPSGPD